MFEKEYKIALIGNPNSGKTTLFNQLTGLNQKVGNFPGVTVERKSGDCILENGEKVTLIDLPGTYSIYPKSYDEKVVFDILTDVNNEEFPDQLIVIVDSSNLKRNLLLFTQMYDLGIPIILGLNMSDIAEKSGLDIYADKLSAHFDNIPVLKLNARKGEGLSELKECILNLKTKAKSEERNNFINLNKDYLPFYSEVKNEIGTSNLYEAQLIAHQYKTIRWIPAYKKIKIAEIAKNHEFDSIKVQTNETILRYQKINTLLEATVNSEDYKARHRVTEVLDRIFTHKVFGYASFLIIFYLVFMAIFSWASYPQDWIDGGMVALNNLIRTNLPESPMVDLLTNGIIAGLGGVIMFVPQIALLFAFVSILEETGYMARVMFLMDYLMKPFGLNGKSIVPLFSGTACAIPAIMATRNIGNLKERLITIFVLPLISCSARIPVYTMIIALIIPNVYFFNILSLQGLTMMGLYFLGFLTALLSALLLKLIVKSPDKSFFILEMPDYKPPRWKNVLINVIANVKAFVFGAGKIIVAISIVLWFLSSYGPKEAMKEAEEQAVTEYKNGSNEPSESLENRISAAKLENSYAGYFGRAIEPILHPLGFNWKIGIAILTSFAAREVFIGTISTLYSVGDENTGSDLLKQKLARQTDEETGKPYFNFARGASLLVFYAFALQCMSTIAVVKKETGKWSIALIQFLYMAFLSYFSALIVYQLLSIKI